MHRPPLQLEILRLPVWIFHGAVGVELEDFAEGIERDAEEGIGVDAHVEVELVGDEVVAAVADESEELAADVHVVRMQNALGGGEVAMGGIGDGEAGNERSERAEKGDLGDVAVVDLDLAAAVHGGHVADGAGEMGRDGEVAARFFVMPGAGHELLEVHLGEVEIEGVVGGIITQVHVNRAGEVAVVEAALLHVDGEAAVLENERALRAIEDVGDVEEGPLHGRAAINLDGEVGIEVLFLAGEINLAVGADEGWAGEMIWGGIKGELGAHDGRDLGDVDLRDHVMELDGAVLEIVNERAGTAAFGAMDVEVGQIELRIGEGEVGRGVDKSGRFVDEVVGDHLALDGPRIGLEGIAGCGGLDLRPSRGEGATAEKVVHPLTEDALEDGGIETRGDLAVEDGRVLGAVEEELEIDVAGLPGHLQAGDEEALAVVRDGDAEAVEGLAVESEVAPVEVGLDVSVESLLQIEEDATGRRRHRIAEIEPRERLPEWTRKGGRERGEVHRRGELERGGVVAEVPLAVGGELAALEADLEIGEFRDAVGERAADGELIDGCGAPCEVAAIQLEVGAAAAKVMRRGLELELDVDGLLGSDIVDGLRDGAPQFLARGDLLLGREGTGGGLGHREPVIVNGAADAKREVEETGLGVLNIDVLAVEGDLGVDLVEIGGLVRAERIADVGVGDAGAVDESASAPPTEPRDADAHTIDLEHNVLAVGVAKDGHAVGEDGAGGIEQQVADGNGERDDVPLFDFVEEIRLGDFG